MNGEEESQQKHLWSFKKNDSRRLYLNVHYDNVKIFFKIKMQFCKYL